jgi:hypothetical protein
VTDFVGYFIIVQSEDNIIVDHLKNIESYIQDKNKVSMMFDRLDIVVLAYWYLFNYRHSACNFSAIF